ncbi:MAG TPA: NAD kinase [Gammaproteobacteria bacterium]|nr:NAD kinase [Gammaproteobacteria bacterium]
MSTTDKQFEKIAFLSIDKTEAKTALAQLIKKYGNSDPGSADVIVPLGGDGFMLETIRKYMPLVRRGLPVYGMNQGTVGFLMNSFHPDDLRERLANSIAAEINPLKMRAISNGGVHEALAINEISLLRQTRQAAHIRISIDGDIRLDRLMADGVLIATPAGSTAYNLSAHGPALPLGSEVLALTPISAFRPRRWRGAILKNTAKVSFEILDAAKRPVSAVADSTEIRNVTEVHVEQMSDITFTLLFDKDHALDEKILREQFAT